MCYKCGECCKNLYWSDRVLISLRTKTLMLKKNCKFMDDNKLCKIYTKRPRVCRDWYCGPAKIKSDSYIRT